MHKQEYLTAGLCLGTIFYGQSWRSVLVMLTQANIHYTGIHITLFGATLYRMHHSKHPQRLPVYLYIPIVIMAIFGTISIACATAFIHQAWSEALRLNLTGGPLQWIQGNVWRSVNVISEAIVPPLFFMQDIILVSLFLTYISAI
jgi:hypothetical protein